MPLNNKRDDTPRFVPTDRTGWIRDTQTGAVLSTNLRGAREYRERAEKLKENIAKIDHINTLEQQLQELRDIVNVLVNKEK